MKFNKRNDLGNKVLIIIAVLVGISVLSYFAHESSPVGRIGNIIFQFLTMPILAVGGFIVLWDTFKDFFSLDYFKKDFSLVTFIFHLLWLTVVIFFTGLICFSVFRSYSTIFV